MWGAWLRKVKIIKFQTETLPKDLMLAPERLGILLQQDGWWVRSKAGELLAEQLEERAMAMKAQHDAALNDAIASEQAISKTGLYDKERAKLAGKVNK
jgi:hypothetical protein